VVVVVTSEEGPPYMKFYSVNSNLLLVFVPKLTLKILIHVGSSLHIKELLAHMQIQHPAIATSATVSSSPYTTHVSLTEKVLHQLHKQRTRGLRFMKYLTFS